MNMFSYSSLRKSSIVVGLTLIFGSQALANRPVQAPRPENNGINVALLAVQQNLKPVQNRLGIVSIADSRDTILVPLVRATPRARQRLANRLNRMLSTKAPGIKAKVIPGAVTRQDLVRLNEKVKETMDEENFRSWGASIDVDSHSIAVSLPSRYFSRGDAVDRSGRPAAQTGRPNVKLGRAATRLNQKLVRLASTVLGSRLRGLSASNLIQIEEGEFARIDRRQELQHYPANWLEVNGGGGCTAGFLMKRADGTLRGTTAGHCAAGVAGRVGDDIFTNGNFVGTTVGNTFVHPTSSDLLSYSVPGHWGWNFIQPFADGGGWLVTNSIVESQSNVEVCHSGRGLWREEGVETSCGLIKRIDHSRTDDEGVRHDNMDCTEDRGYPGDSGGAMWNWGDDRGVWAAGHVSVGYTTGSLWWKKYYTCYHVLNDIRAEFGYVLVTH